MNIGIDPGAVLTITALVAGGTIYSFLKSRHIERMQQLQMGIPIEDQQSNFLEIKIGSLLLGLGVGILIAYIIDVTSSIDTSELYAALTFICGGIGLIASYLTTSRLKRKL